MVRSESCRTSPVAEQLWLVGESPLSRALARMAASVGFELTLLAGPEEASAQAAFAGAGKAPVSAVVLLNSIEDQAAVLRHWQNVPFVFLGLLGTRGRKAEIVSLLQSGGAPRELLDRIQCPVGLPIGASDPEEMAISIIAQLIQNRSDRRISHEAASLIRSPSLIKARAA